MVTYVVASRAHQPYLSECQILGEYLNKNAPDVSVQFVIKDGTEWKVFLNSVCRSYGFEKKSCPIIYTLEGTLIGSGADFVEHVRERYDKQVPVSKEQQKGRTKLNIAENEQRMRKKEKGDSLGEQILKNMKEAIDNKTANIIDDAFYQEQIENGLPFQVRRTDYLRDKPMKGLDFARYHDIPDEVMLRANLLAVVEEKESQRDRSYEEFLEMFANHIEGKVDANDRVGNRPSTAEAAEDRDQRAVGGDQSLDGSRIQANRSVASESKHSSNRPTTKQSEIKQDILPKNCTLSLPAKTKVRDLDDGYALLMNPYPQIEGEMLLIQFPEDENQKKEEEKKEEEEKEEKEEEEDDDKKEKKKKKKDKKEKEPDLIYKDYSLRKRLFTMAKTKASSKSALAKKQELELDQTKTKIQNLEVDLESPLSSLDWNYISMTIREIDALIWFQVLPANQKSSHPFQFNCFHVLPNQNIPFTILPIEKMIKNKMTFKNRQDKQQRDQSKGPVGKNDPVHQRDSEAFETGLVLLDEFPFPHAVIPITPQDMNEEGLKNAYQQVCKFLNLKNNQDPGITVIIAPQFMFVCQIWQPYHITSRPVMLDGEFKPENQQQAETDVSLFLDGFAYCGILNLQLITQKWPATAGLNVKQYTLMEAFNKQSSAVLI